MAEHTLLQDNHKIKFEDTQILSTTKSYYARLYRKAIEIYKHKYNFNKKEESLIINKAWYTAVKNIKTKPMKKQIKLPDLSDKSGSSISHAQMKRLNMT